MSQGPYQYRPRDGRYMGRPSFIRGNRFQNNFNYGPFMNTNFAPKNFGHRPRHFSDYCEPPIDCHEVPMSHEHPANRGSVNQGFRGGFRGRSEPTIQRNVYFNQESDVFFPSGMSTDCRKYWEGHLMYEDPHDRRAKVTSSETEGFHHSKKLKDKSTVILTGNYQESNGKTDMHINTKQDYRISVSASDSTNELQSTNNETLNGVPLNIFGIPSIQPPVSDLDIRDGKQQKSRAIINNVNNSTPITHTPLESRGSGQVFSRLEKPKTYSQHIYDPAIHFKGATFINSNYRKMEAAAKQPKQKKKKKLKKTMASLSEQLKTRKETSKKSKGVMGNPPEKLNERNDKEVENIKMVKGQVSNLYFVLGGSLYISYFLA